MGTARSSSTAGLAFATACAAAPAPQDGFETGPCVQGDCLGDLVCLSDLCVDPNASGSTSEPPDDDDDDSVSTESGEVTGTSGDPDESTGSTDPQGEGVRLDVVFIVDNSAGMGGAQHRLASQMPAFVEDLRARADAVDVRVMVTTTDFGNPLCTPFEPAGYDPAQGKPQGLPCTERLHDFTGLTGVEHVEAACTDVCPEAVAPEGAPFVQFTASDDNVPAGDVAAALQCLVPQGINGCGYEAPLETMLQALGPNVDGQPFVRADADLALVILTDEHDCSVQDYSVMMDADFQEIDPQTGEHGSSSALCFHAGVTCDGPDGSGTYASCGTAELEKLRPLSRYADFITEQRVAGKRVTVVPLVGIAPDGPTTYRTWRDGTWPAGDILPGSGASAADMTFGYGALGPGCTTDAEIGYIQALPSVRILGLCEQLDDIEGGRCCTGSICDPTFGGALECLIDDVRVR